jgi:hypothetical protein
MYSRPSLTGPMFSGAQAPTLTASDIDAVVAFLCTLTDGYDPANPSAYNVPAQCQPTATTTSAAANTSGNRFMTREVTSNSMTTPKKIRASPLLGCALGTGLLPFERERRPQPGSVKMPHWVRRMRCTGTPRGCAACGARVRQ